MSSFVREEIPDKLKAAAGDTSSGCLPVVSDPPINIWQRERPSRPAGGGIRRNAEERGGTWHKPSVCEVKTTFPTETQQEVGQLSVLVPPGRFWDKC